MQKKYKMETKEIQLKRSSWENIIECIRDSNLNVKGNFWASIQSIEEQLGKSTKEKIIKNLEEEETETNDYILCDDCQTSIHIKEHDKNKGLCDDCVERRN